MSKKTKVEKVQTVLIQMYRLSTILNDLYKSSNIELTQEELILLREVQSEISKESKNILTLTDSSNKRVELAIKSARNKEKKELFDNEENFMTLEDDLNDLFENALENRKKSTISKTKKQIN